MFKEEHFKPSSASYFALSRRLTVLPHARAITPDLQSKGNTNWPWLVDREISAPTAVDAVEPSNHRSGQLIHSTTPYLQTNFRIHASGDKSAILISLECSLPIITVGRPTDDNQDVFPRERYGPTGAADLEALHA